MNCLLFRHGIAIDRELWDASEAERPLTSKGVDKTTRAAQGFRKLDVNPTHILSSPFTRAVETAKLVQEALHFRHRIQLCDELLPDAPPDKLLVLLNALPPDSFVLCVGHEPHLSEAAGLMLFGRPALGLSLKKAGACLIEFESAPKAGQGLLNWWVTPSQLRSLKRQ